ncbi:hypothetical protein E05_10950 [Plautia stali symbiont]|nr:hypothetical protein E05_10950 [Plautia stali symbiont]
MLFAADGFVPSATLLQEVAKLSHQRPELNCLLVSLAPRALSSGLQPSLQLFQQLQAQCLWQQNNYAVILRAALVKNAAPLVRI